MTNSIQGVSAFVTSHDQIVRGSFVSGDSANKQDMLYIYMWATLLGSVVRFHAFNKISVSTAMPTALGIFFREN